ncbi:hypothetical protein T552_03023 [Pneumocystis carinii B80]|uniref:RRM domain-containing protein n=1 Tax=Pneumocystis carinii (strain B80) TaxID=1408658 RepID=A0A0W4ZCT7_PNEC8|nr:hypothetical protein T552_03023 [Pneumocystis carinii B80]KTW26129.1 hypothetical protein T552_03023 [Pneumocystis carinii B80]
MDTFESILQGLWKARPPGVSGSKIHLLTQIAVQHVKDGGRMAMLLYKHFKKTPGSHKLGVLYVLDSVARAYQDLAEEDETVEDGTFSGGLQQLTVLLESLMNDMMFYAPAEHKKKVRKLVDIWERAATFPSELLVKLRSVHFSDEEDLEKSVNQENDKKKVKHVDRFGVSEEKLPEKSKDSEYSDSVNQLTSSASSSSLILEAILQMAQKIQGTQTMQNADTTWNSLQPGVNVGGVPMTGFENSVSFGTSSSTLSSGSGGLAATSTMPNDFNASTSFLSSTSNASGTPIASTTASSLSLSDPRNIYPSGLPFSVPTHGNIPSLQPSSDVVQAQQRALLQLLEQQGVSATQIQSIIQYVQSLPSNDASAGALPPNNVQPTLQTVEHSQQLSKDMQTATQHSSILGSHTTIPLYQYLTGGRNVSSGISNTTLPRSSGDSQTSIRSRSPLKRKSSMEQLSTLNRSRDSAKLKSSRKRSERSLSPSEKCHSQPSAIPSESLSSPPSKLYIRDPSVPEDTIKVLSRTLFVGGITQSITQEELLRMFSCYGDVQSCIVNYAARHAFIKMYKRKDAEAACANLETIIHGDVIIRTKWGVGFGPRDCSNYTIGISLIPLRRLTEADRRWCVSAGWGGTGGRPLEGGFVMEEPDIEIGAGVSSKLISRRLPLGRSEQKNDGNRPSNPSIPSQVAQSQSQSQSQSQPPSTLVSPWIGAIRENAASKIP